MIPPDMLLALGQLAAEPAAPVPTPGPCPECLSDDDRHDRPGVVRTVAPGVVQCSRCWYRVAHGERAPHVAVTGDEQWRVVRITPPEGLPVTIRIDRALAAMLAKNLL